VHVFDAIIVVGALAALLLCAEFAARMRWHVPFRPYMGRERIYHPFFRVHPLAAYHPTLGWVGTPNWQRKDEHSAYVTCDHGTRLPSNQQRALPIGGILVCGNSFVVGSGVGNDKSWPAQLEAMIGTPVVNAAAGGWGTDQMVLRTEQMIALTRPRAVVLGLMWFDAVYAELSSYYRAAKPYFTIEDGRLQLHNSPAPLFTGICHRVPPVRWLMSRCYLAFIIAQGCGMLRWPGAEDPEHERASPPGTGIEISRKLLRRLKETTDRLGIKLLVIAQVTADDFDEAIPLASHTALTKAVRDVAIPMIDLWPHFKWLFDHDRPSFFAMFIQQPNKRYDHMSERANRFVAEEVATALGSAAALPSGPELHSVEHRE
jgi:hypothetical protein